MFKFKYLQLDVKTFIQAESKDFYAMKVHGWINSEDIFIMNEDEVKKISTSD